MRDKTDDSIRFVARHYEPGAFADRQGRWSRSLPRAAWWRRHPAAAAAIAGAVFAASAAGAYMAVSLSSPGPAAEPAATPAPAPAVPADTATVQIPAEDKSLVLSFSDAPLSEVCDAIESSYGVTLADVPVSDETLTLDYEGDAADLVGTINDLLGTHIRIVK